MALVQRDLWIITCLTLLLVQPRMSYQQVAITEPLMDNFLIFADSAKASIYQMSLDGSKYYKFPLTMLKKPVAVDYDPTEKKIYWTDVDADVIKRAYLNGTVEDFQTLKPVSSAEGIAIDPTAGLAFYTDSGALSINVVQLNSKTGRFSKKIIWEGLKNPRTIQVSPKERRIYWTDWGKQVIESSNYDGTDRKTLVNINDAWLNGLALDLQDDKMYWSDAYDDRIETSNLDGTARTTIINRNSTLYNNGTAEWLDDVHYYGVAVDETYLYFTDWNNKSVQRSKKDGSGIQTIGPAKFTRLQGIHLYKKSRYIKGTSSKCNIKNGGCSHLCVPRKADVVCLCPAGIKMASNGKTCGKVSGAGQGPALVWIERDLSADTSFVRGILGDPTIYLVTREVRPWQVRSPAYLFRALEIDYENKLVFLSDEYDRYIVKMKLDGSADIKVIYFGTSSQVEGLAYDWVGKNLYWTDSIYNCIMMSKTDVNTKMVRMVINGKLDKPHGIAVHPRKGYLFWTDWGEIDKIERASLAGSDRKIIVNQHISNPRGLVIDYMTDRLFWVNDHLLKSSNLDGGEMQTHGGYNKNNFFGLSLFKNYTFVTDKGKTKSQGGNGPQMYFYDITTPMSPTMRLPLRRQPYGVAMYDKTRQPNVTSSCQTMACQHFCVPTADGGGECVCSDGYVLDNDNKSCKAHSFYQGPAYIYSMGDRLCAMHVKAGTSKTNGNIDSSCFFRTPKFKFSALAFNYYSGDIYFSDHQYKVPSIRRANMHKKQNNSVVVYGPGNALGIGIDWISYNMYWTANLLNQIWVARLDGTFQKILLENVKAPHGIAIDPIRQYIYWTEQGSKPLIGRARLDGSERTVFVQRNMKKPTGLTIDFADSRLYWIDVGKKKIESVSLTGSERKTAYHNNRNLILYDVAVFKDFLVFSDHYNNTGIHIVNKYTGVKIKDLVHNKVASQEQAFDVIAYDRSNQPIEQGPVAGSCALNRGGCEQLCLQRRLSRTCACTDGKKLGPNEKTCEPEYPLMRDNFILVADDYRHQVYQLDENAKNVTAPNFPPNDRPISIDYDFEEDRLYWSDFNAGIIRRAFMNGTEMENIKESLINSRVDGIAYEPHSKLIYYTDMGRHIIAVKNREGTYQKILIQDRILYPRAIVLDSQQGMMYYTSRQTQKSKIERASMDGTARMQIIKENDRIQWPTGLAIDFVEGRIYWCDAHSETLESATLMGADRKIIKRLPPAADPFGVAIDGNFIYWTDWRLRGLFRADKRNGDAQLQIKPSYFTGLNDVKVYRKKNLPKPTACAKNNGGCSHFCFPQGGGKKVCGCPNNVPLQDDKLSCFGVQKCGGVILNGQLVEPCGAQVGKSCEFKCNPGFGRTQTKALTCMRNLLWDAELTTLCHEKSCSNIFKVDPDKVNMDCPTTPGVGVKCTFFCKPGFMYKSGDRERICKTDTTWTGTDLKCTGIQLCPPLSTIPNARLDKAACGKQGSAVGTSCIYSCTDGYEMKGKNAVKRCKMGKKGPKWDGIYPNCVRVIKPIPSIPPSLASKQENAIKLTPMLIGIIAAIVAVIMLIIILLAVYLRRRTSKAHGRYVDHPNIEQNGQTAVPVANGKEPYYDVRSGDVSLGSLAFDNPAYATHAEVQAQAASARAEQAPPLPDKEPIEGAVAVGVDLSDDAKDKDGFSNPLFTGEGDPYVKYNKEHGEEPAYATLESITKK